MTKDINFAVIGAGGFAYFAVTEFAKVKGAKLAGVYDENQANAARLKTIDRSVKVYMSLEILLHDAGIDMVYIATPPALHYVQSKKALLAGKHVICEKPAAIKLEHAEELKSIAEQQNLLFVVNLMQRYNPLYCEVDKIIKSQLLGKFLHGFFENYASDEFLIQQHWFWNPERSGGIFIEHGVHFFDMFNGWFGPGKVIAAQKLARPNFPCITDRVQATVLYSEGIVNFYHGFDQPKVMDRQELRLQFERGDITLYEWVPTQLKMTAVCCEDGLSCIRSVFPEAKIEILESHHPPVIARGRFNEIKYSYKLKLDTGDATKKMQRYQQLVCDMFKDQLNWINDRSHKRKIDQDNAVHSLKMAVDADKLAMKV